MSGKKFKINKIAILLIFLLALFLRIWRLDYPDFIPDEGHYAYDAFHVYKNNPGMVCRFHMQYHYEGQLGHPCLAQWLISISYKIFSPNVFSARFVSALTGSLIVFIIYFISKSIFINSSTGLIAAAFYATFPLAVKYDRTTYLDTLQTFMLSIVLAIFIKFNKSKNLIYAILLGATTALLLLTKLSAPLIFLFFLIQMIVLLKRNIKEAVIKYSFIFIGFAPVFFLGANPSAYFQGIIHPTDRNFNFANISFSFTTLFNSLLSQSFSTYIPIIFIIFCILGIIRYIKNKKPSYLLICFLSWLPLAGLYIIGHPNIYRLLPLVFLGSFFAAYYINSLVPNRKFFWLVIILFIFIFRSLKWSILETNKLDPINNKIINYFKQINLNKNEKIYLYEIPNNFFYLEDQMNFYLNPTWENGIKNNPKCVISNKSQDGQNLTDYLIKSKGYSVKESFSNGKREIIILCKD
ncbi:ArnT family glycosyltransferase [Patescibacteria group bacterium]